MAYGNFIFEQRTRIVFGPSSLEKLAEELAAERASHILVVYGGGSIKRTGLFDRVLQRLHAIGARIVEHGGCQPNPRNTWIDEGARLYRESGCDFVLGIGGGSVLDASKAIGMAVANPHPEGIWYHFRNKKTLTHPCPPIGAIVTLAGTGSEANGGFVVTNEAAHEKSARSHPSACPSFSICDPQLTYTVNRWQTASGAADIISHYLEQYLHVDTEVDVSDGIILGILKAVIRWAPVALEKPNDYSARANLMWASTLALNGLMKAGHRMDYTMHTLEHALSAVHDVTHGAGLACLTPYYLDYLAPQDRTQRIGRLGVELFGLDRTDEALSHKTACAFRDFFVSLGLPARLRDFPDVNITRDSLVEVARKATQIGPAGFGGWRGFETEDALRLLESAY